MVFPLLDIVVSIIGGAIGGLDGWTIPDFSTTGGVQITSTKSGVLLDHIARFDIGKKGVLWNSYVLIEFVNLIPFTNNSTTKIVNSAHS